MGHLLGYFSDCMSCAGDDLVGGLVGAIASEKLPGERGGAKIMEIGAGVAIPPIALVWHLRTPQCPIIFRSAHNYYAALLKLWIARLSLSVDTLIDTGTEFPGIDHLAPFNECNSR
jgi:hypothetical protein